MDYLSHLSKDKKFAQLLSAPLSPLQLRKNIPLRLMASIMSQQLHTKVAKVIFHRFLHLFGGEEPTPEQVLATETETLRAIGLSYAKIKYIQNVALFCIKNNIDDTKLLTMSNEEIIDLLTQIKGVGRWTVEMLLMFSLGREDVFAVDDLGVQNAMKKIYTIKDENKKEVKAKMLKISARWKPYRTYACMHLWQWKDNKPETDAENKNT
ncbi:MAG: DNA-3-methyladenine glycosylase 2 family protein [Bacteroidota bacterium]|nr:DNA-3-methyladenine glycosylase 2 family protein [Bacteroidota bacterium]